VFSQIMATVMQRLAFIDNLVMATVCPPIRTTMGSAWFKN
jgi:hypothetical protein